MLQVFQAITDALDKGETIAVLTVVQASGSTPRHLSSNMLVRVDGSFIGSIGGGTMEWQAIQDARDAIRDQQSRLLDYNLVGKTPGTLGMCGGTEQVFIDVIAPAQRADH
jgi:xanthine dehydrogenase accessory factor